jgi:hypothetical protein
VATGSLRIGTAIVISALSLGVAGDFLLRATPWGINVAIFITLVAVVIAFLVRQLEGGPAIFPWLSVPVLFAEFFLWRDSPFLQLWGVFAIIAAFVLIALKRYQTRLFVARIWDFVTGAVDTGINVLIGTPLLALSDVEWGHLTRSKSSKRVGSVATGAVLAIPLLLIFGPLLASADPIFARLVDSAFRWNLPELTSHLLLASFLAWISAGYLRSLFFARRTSPHWLEGLKAPKFGLIEIGIALGSLAFLFSVFVAVQARYLFGGEEIVQATIGLSYADYARRGFFELVAVTTLVLPVLLAADWALDHGTSKYRLSFTILAAVILVLVGLIMISALARMRLYVQAYGLTADRFYATAFMFWIALLLAWFAATVLRGLRTRFAFGAVTSGFATLAILNVLNPDGLIARSNLERPGSGRELDVQYLLTLSADAAPTLLAGLPALPEPERCQLELGIREARWGTRSLDWRSWNLSRARARRALERTLPNLDCNESASRSRLPAPIRYGPTS